MTDELITSIARQLNIPQSAGSEWICQVVYSVAGQMALASLWDHHEDASTISIRHFKNRIGQIFDAYERMYPKVCYLLPEDKSVLIDTMYDIYLRNGYFYHSPHQISPAAPATASYQGVTLHRGSSPDAKLLMSGLGFYSVQKTNSDRTITQMFGLQEQSFESYLQEMMDYGEWEPIQWPEKTDFLRLVPPFTRGYWQQKAAKDGRISVARYGEPNQIYVFYRFFDCKYQQKQIPEWRIRDYFSNDAGYGEYRRIAIALLKQYGNLPDIVAKTSGDLMEVSTGYRLPPSEEAFFRLFSWPVRYEFSAKLPPVFTRKMTKQIYPMFKHTLESMGYRFVEE